MKLKPLAVLAATFGLSQLSKRKPCSEESGTPRLPLRITGLVHPPFVTTSRKVHKAATSANSFQTVRWAVNAK